MAADESYLIFCEPGTSWANSRFQPYLPILDVGFGETQRIDAYVSVCCRDFRKTHLKRWSSVRLERFSLCHFKLIYYFFSLRTKAAATLWQKVNPKNCARFV